MSADSYDRMPGLSPGFSLVLGYVRFGNDNLNVPQHVTVLTAGVNIPNKLLALSVSLSQQRVRRCPCTHVVACESYRVIGLNMQSIFFKFTVRP